MNKTGLWIGIGVLIVLALGIGLFMSSSAPGDTNEPATSDTQNSAPQSDVSVGVAATTTISVPIPGATASEKTFTVTGQNYSFAPSAITVKKGDKVTIVFKNAGGFHDFRIDEFNVATPRVNDGGQATVTFVADKAGTFEYYCSVGNHRAMGMKGTLTVQE